jgi:hypothetical protein
MAYRRHLITIVAALGLATLCTVDAAALPPRPGAGGRDEGKGGSAQNAQIALYVGTDQAWTVVQWKDLVAWRDVEGWQAAPRALWVVWDVAPAD